MILATIDELMEVLRETPWKPWKKQQSWNIHKIREELIDVLHFFVNLCLAAGIGSNQLHKMYLDKNKINNKRQDEGY
jgi:dimeric dUTPase (all-alpha-NTP-PPase superfamily)